MYIQIVVQSLISLFVLFLLTKWIGCRQISELSMFDYINGITIGSIAAEICIEKEDIIIPLIAMITYGAFTVLLSWLSDKSLFLRRIIEGRPYILYKNNVFLYKNMKKNKIDESEFLMAAREAGYFDLSQVQTAILESNGRISFLPKSQYRPVTPEDMNLEIQPESVFINVVMNGKIMETELKRAGKDKNWLEKQMKIHNVKHVEEVFLAACDANNSCYFWKKSDQLE